MIFGVEIRAFLCRRPSEGVSEGEKDVRYHMIRFTGGRDERGMREEEQGM